MDEEREMMSRLLVAVRVRPISQKELTKDRVAIIAKPIDDKTILVLDPADDWTDDILRKDRPKEKVYSFDSVFSETASQMDVYHGTVRFLIESVMEGYNATVFAYGATGAGKTFTMLGTESRPGIMALTLADLFNKIQKGGIAHPDETCDVSLTYLEIYNENIRDLLSGKPDLLDLRDDGSRGTVVAGITTVTASSAEEVMMFLRRGNRNRSQEPTGANEVSSRSHAVLQVLVTFKRVDARGNHIERHGKLSMIDLAGSERAAETNNRGLRMIEGANINRSLLALGNCINALGETGKRGKYVNYRDSKLTRLLKDSLGGNCKTVMIANISPSSTNFDETMNTLKYASRARTIKNKISQQVSNKTEAYTTALSQMKSSGSRQRLTSAATNTTSGFESLGRQSRMRTAHDDTRHPPPDGLAELIAGLDSKYKEITSLKNQVLEIDEHEAGCILELDDAQSEMETIREKLSEISVKDEDKRHLFEEALEKKSREVAEIEDVKKEIVFTREGLIAQKKELEKKVKSDQQQFNSSKDSKAVNGQLKGKIHSTEMANLELDASHTLSMALITQNQSEREQLYRLIAVYEQIVQFQLKERTTPIPSELSSLLNVLRDLKERLNITHINEVPKMRSREYFQLQLLNQRLSPKNSSNIEIPNKKQVNIITSGFAKLFGKPTDFPPTRKEPMIPETSFILPPKEEIPNAPHVEETHKMKRDDSMKFSNASSPVTLSPKLGFKKSELNQQNNFSSSLQNLARQVEDLIRPKSDYVEQFKARNQERVSKLATATPTSMKSDFTNSGTLYDANSKNASDNSLTRQETKRNMMQRADSDISFRRDSVARALKADDDRRKTEIENFKPKDTKKIMEMFGSKSARQAILEQAYGMKSNPPKSRMKSQGTEKAGIFKFKPVFHSKSGGEGVRSRQPTNEANNNAY